MTTDSHATLHVLVVDDSALVRTLLAEMLGRQPGMVVQVAADPLIAIEKMKRFRPHVIVLDLEMPRMDGLTLLRKIMADDPIPVVICSGHTGQGSERAFQAIADGAVDIITKPQAGVREFLLETEILLVDAVRAAAGVPLARRGPARTTASAEPPRSERTAGRRAVGSDPIVAMGASIGGTEALERVLVGFPEGGPPTLVVQHMPAAFTGPFAKRLDAFCRIDVREARHGEALHWGCALLAPGDRHLTLARRAEGFVVEIGDGPLVSRHRPSVDVLFSSIARVAGPRAVGVILTGMGADGAAGLLEMRAQGARTLAQDEATSVVFGMPQAAIALGAVETVLPIDGIAAALLERAHASAPR